MNTRDASIMLNTLIGFNTKRPVFVSALTSVAVMFVMAFSDPSYAQRTLTIQNANGQTAGVIELSNTAQVDFRVTTTGITLGLPVGVSFTCQGSTTANGSCDATAGATASNGGGNTAATDSDSDGVPDSSDQCSNTPAGEFANSAGCSPSQLDDDGDGVSNAADQCANTPSGTSVDTTGCPVTTNSTPPANNTGNTGAYCDGAPSNVTCSPSNNMDPWWDYSPEIAQKLDGTILSLPFSTRASSRDGGQVGFTTYQGAFIDGESFRAWISETPGGRPLRADSDCNVYMAQARGGMYWTQNAKYENNTRFCYLGQAERTLYLNMEACIHDSTGLDCQSSRVGGYRFDIRRSYRAY
jgi:hypothetical protein